MQKRRNSTKKIYLDSCILIAYFSITKEELEKKEIIKAAFSVIKKLNLDVRIYTSRWAIAEMINILLSRMKLKNDYVLSCESALLNSQRIENIKVEIVNVEGDVLKYDFQEFFYNIRECILKYHSGVGDTIHSVIMENNDIDTILTFDEKKDFKQIKGLTVLHPRDIKL